jgi:Transcriptional regulatory protein, C terminal
VLSSPPFRLDLVEERLWKGNREVRLRRKPFAILRFLAQNPRRLVTQAEIVDAVWRRIASSDPRGPEGPCREIESHHRARDGCSRQPSPFLGCICAERMCAVLRNDSKFLRMFADFRTQPL